MNFVTVIIPVGPNHEAIVHEAVRSVQQQTVACDLLLVPDKEGRGPAWARNQGLISARTPFVVFLDADDQLLPTFVEVALAHWQPGHYVYTQWHEDTYIRPFAGEVALAEHLVTTLLSTDIALNAGGFDESLSAAEDTEFYIRLQSMGIRKLKVNEPLVYYSSAGHRGREFWQSGKTEATLQIIEARYGAVIARHEEIPEAANLAELVSMSMSTPRTNWKPPTKPVSIAPARPTAWPDISFVVPTCDRLTYLKNMVQSVRQYVPADLGYELVVIDGGSVDGSLQWCQQQADIRLIEHGALLGTVKAFTDGAKAARGRYVVICNDDTEFIDGSIGAAYTWLEARAECGAVAFAYDTPQQPNYFIVGRHSFTRANGQVIEQNFANMGMFRKALGDSVGWCGADDPDFEARSYGSDSYLSVRIWEAGYSIDAVPGAIVHDRDARDKLKRVNQWPPTMDNADTQAFYRRYPQGPEYPLQRLVFNGG